MRFKEIVSHMYVKKVFGKFQYFFGKTKNQKGKSRLTIIRGFDAANVLKWKVFIDLKDFIRFILFETSHKRHLHSTGKRCNDFKLKHKFLQCENTFNI